MIKEVFLKSKKLLKDSGNIFIHCTPKTSSFFKNILDDIFGQSNFVNEIIYKHGQGGNSNHHFSYSHDNILFYRNSANGYFNPEPTAKTRGPIRRNHMKKNTTEDGRVYYSIVISGKEYRYYEDDLIHKGDVWDDIDENIENDRYIYEGEKPLNLLEKIIISACPEKGLVCDPFCGTGVTAIAAAKLGRKFLMCDISHLAINIAKSNIALLNQPFCTVWENIEIFSQKPEVKFSFKNNKVHLDDYRVPGGEKYYSNNLLPTEDTLVENWSVGRLIGDSYYVDDFDVRTHDNPAIGRHLQLKKGEGEPYSLTFDVFGNQIMHKLNIE